MTGPPIKPTIRLRLCSRDGCSNRYDDLYWSDPWPKAYCSPECHRGPLKPAVRQPRTPLVTRTLPKRARPISEASPEQRDAVALRACVARNEGPCLGPVDPAHLIPRGLCPDTDGDPRAVVPLCRRHHNAYDRDGTLDLLPYLEPHFRDELAFAVQRYGLASTYRRVTNERQGPCS